MLSKEDRAHVLDCEATIKIFEAQIKSLEAQEPGAKEVKEARLRLVSLCKLVAALKTEDGATVRRTVENDPILRDFHQDENDLQGRLRKFVQR